MTHEVNARLERVVRFLAQTTLGDWSERIPLEDTGDEKLNELEYGVNMLLDELAQSRAQSEARQKAIEQQHLALIEQQRQMVRLLSTPVITVWPGVLALPILGELGSERATALAESVLSRVVSDRATHIILDLTGMLVAGTETAQSLLRLSQAVRLLGGRCLLTGVSPVLATALVERNFELNDVEALPTLAEAIARVLHERGVQIVTTKRT